MQKFIERTFGDLERDEDVFRDKLSKEAVIGEDFGAKELYYGQVNLLKGCSVCGSG
jgi:hypothetical protein